MDGVAARGDLPAASEFDQREWREGAAALVSYLRREESFRFLTGRSSPATIASMEVRSSVGRRAGDCLVAIALVRAGPPEMQKRSPTGCTLSGDENAV